MANTSFYRLKFRTIHLVIDYWCSGLGGQQHLSILAGWNDIDAIRIWQSVLHESCWKSSPLSTQKRAEHLDHYSSRYV